MYAVRAEGSEDRGVVLMIGLVVDYSEVYGGSACAE